MRFNKRCGFKFISIIFLFVNATTFAQSHFDVDKISLDESRKFEGIINSTHRGSDLTNNYDLFYHRLVWEIDPQVLYVKGEITSFFNPLTPGFTEIYFDLSYALTVDSVKFHDTLISYNHFNDNTVRANLPYSIQANILDSITIFYQGSPTASGFGSFVKSSHLGSPIIWTLSEPFGANEWWPCKDGLYDKVDSIDIFVTTPNIYKVASQGLLINTTVNGTNNTYHWKHRYPIATYLISLSITNYAEFTINANLTQGILPILNYVYPEDSLSSYQKVLLIQPIIELYDSLFGAYPFMNEKYGHAQFGWGGGMEHQTMSTMGSFSESLMAHELAHQWFGDKITCSSWSDIWLNEGFATYSTGLFYKHIATAWWEAWKEDMITSSTSLPGGAVYNADTTSVARIFDSRLSYKKASYLLRMLEWKLGSTIFFQAINNYISDVNLAYNFVSTQTFKNHLEMMNGDDLSEFFSDWFYGEGYPSYEITWNQNSNVVKFKVDQIQSHNSVSFFEMPLPIYCKGQGLDTTFVLNHTFSGENFTFNVPFTIDSVFFDQERWILSANNSVVVGMEDLNSNFDVRIYPNPTYDLINISSNKMLRKISIYDKLGRNVYVSESNIKSNFMMISLSHFKKGTYTIELEGNGGKIRRMINKL